MGKEKRTVVNNIMGPVRIDGTTVFTDDDDPIASVGVTYGDDD